MRRAGRILFALTILLLVSLRPAGFRCACATAAPELLDRIVAVVNGEVITLSDLREAKARMDLRFESPPLLSTETIASPDAGPEDREVLNQLIERRLQLQVARKRGITVSPAETDQFVREIRTMNGLQSEADFVSTLARQNLTPEQYARDAEEQLMILKLASREAKEGILLDEDELLEYYQKDRDMFRLADGYELRQILLKVPDPSLEEERLQEARKLVSELNAGADFESLVLQHSEGPEAKDGGRIGFVEKGHMLPAIEGALEGLAAGNITEPVRTVAGIHIFRVEEVRKGAYRSFEEAKPAVRDRVFQEHVTRRYQEWLNEIRREADVEIMY